MYIIDAYAIFIEDREIGDCSRDTLEFYKYSAGRFVESCGNAECTEVGPFVAPYFLGLRQRVEQAKLSHTSLHTYWRGIRTFLRFLHAEGYVDAPVRIPRVRAPETTIRPLQAPDVTALFRLLDANTFAGLRNQVMLRVMFDSGVRLRELTGMDVADADLREGWLFVRGKGRKERHAPVGKETRRALWKWVKQRAPKATCEALWISTRGTRLTTHGIQTMFRRLADRAGLKGVRLSPHTMRHSFALALLESGCDPKTLQTILGHSTPAMTLKYVHASRSTVKRQHERHSPGDRI